MRIALDGIPLLTPLTGIGKYTFELATALKSLQEKPDVRFFYGIHWVTRLRHRAQDEDKRNVITYTKTHKKNRWIPDSAKKWLKQQIAELEFAVYKPNLFHATNFVADICDIPMVVTVHDLSFLRYPEKLPKERIQWLSEGLPRTLNEASHVIADSSFTKKELISLLGVNEKKIDVVHLGVTPDFRPRNHERLAAKLKEYELEPDGYILSVGTIEPRKNISRLIHAYELLPDPIRSLYPLVVVGMRGWKDEAISNLMEKLARKGELRILGYIPDDKLPFVYSGASLFVYPSVYEGFGLPPLEAMACGVPVVVSNKTSLPEITETAGVLIDPYDVESLSLTVQSLLNDKAKREQMTISGIQQAKKFTWDACAERTLSVYKKVIEQY